MKRIMQEAIDNCLIVTVTFNSKTKGLVTRECIPFDIGPSSKDKIRIIKYHFYSLDSPGGGHNISINPKDILTIQITNYKFDPKDYVTWDKIKWHYPRNWGKYSYDFKK